MTQLHALAALAFFVSAGAVHAQEDAPAQSTGEAVAALAPDFASSMPDGGHFALLDAAAPSCRPVYPKRAENARTQGDTVLGFTLSEQGQVIAAGILKSSGHSPEHRLLDRAALATLVRCPVTAGTDATGRPAMTSIAVTYKWRLN